MPDVSLADKVKAQIDLEEHGQTSSNPNPKDGQSFAGEQKQTHTEEITTTLSRGEVEDGNDGDDQQARDKNNAAALVLQRNYRGYQVRNKMKGVQLDKNNRWDELVKQTNHMTDEHTALENKNDPKTRWRRGVNAATRLQTGDGLYSPGTEEKAKSDGEGPSTHESASAPRDGEEHGDDTSLDSDPKAQAKRRRHKKASLLGVLSMGIGKGDGGRGETQPLPYTSKGLEEQHWLEMLDGKHRYGSNLKFYFKAWKEADTKDNFFRWLDRGEGKTLSLPELSRDQLEKERITYLSAEQRLNYLVRIGQDGYLRWAHNGERVDTTPGKWKDGGDGRGVIRADAEADGDAEDEAHASGMDTDSLTSSVSSSDLSSAELQAEEGTHYVDVENQSWLQRKKANFTPAGMGQNLLRKTIRKNTWIYVSDMKFNIFVGIKTSGTFQHSSFLSGGKVTSAGLIVVKNGLIKNISPLSGHYRSSIEHYKSFIARMEHMGADLSHVKVGKSVAVLWGLSHYGRATKAKKQLTHDIKQKLHISHDKDEQEKSAELKKHAEEQRHVKKTDSNLMETFRRNVLYGRQNSSNDASRNEKQETAPSKETSS